MSNDKKEKLAAAGYIFDSDLSCFVNKSEGRIFSSIWVEQNNANTLQVALATPHQSGEWKIYLNPEQPYQETRATLFEKYGRRP